ncbi:MAG: toll/interleukin-1 receptor domain-containing protein [Phaeodactylibacter sp.]|nr:toll/interleukin-1 receptor domain-containing protein [Phaeodactylibacter sp.]
MPEPAFTLSENTRHYLAYVPWRTILNWRREEIKAGRRHKDSQSKPYAFATRIGQAFKYLRNGDVIWILTIPYYGKYGSFPTLNAMLVVEDKVDRVAEQDRGRLAKVPPYFNTKGAQRQWRYIFFGNQATSRYFPINNCLEQLRPLLPAATAQKLESGAPHGYGFLGMAFQRARAISPEQGQQLFEFQQNLHKQKSLFISYRHREEPDLVGSIVEGLLQAGLVCWFDLNRIPPEVSKGVVEKPLEFFKEELLQAVEACDGLLAIESDAYWKSYWTGLEYGAAQALSALKPGFRFFKAQLPLLDSEAERQKLIAIASQFHSFPIISEN